MRPAPVELIAPKLVRAVQFPRRRYQHFFGQRAAVHVVPKTFARQFVFNDAALAGRTRPEPVAIEHVERVDFPAPPIVELAPETNRQLGPTELEISHFSDLLARTVATLDHHRSFSADLFRNRIDLQRFDHGRHRV